VYSWTEASGQRMTLLTRDDFLELFGKMAAALHERGVRGDLFVVGGAAMALAYGARYSTRNLDGVFEPKTVVYEVANDVGRAHGLRPGWLNDAVKGFLPSADPNATTLFDRPGLTVRIASPQYLFAMKAMAARPSGMPATSSRCTGCAALPRGTRRWMPSRRAIRRTWCPRGQSSCWANCSAERQ
jgi:hypothetical protein